jgi:hypothetical protein
MHWRPPFPYFLSENMIYNTEERNKDENPDNEDELPA